MDWTQKIGLFTFEAASLTMPDIGWTTLSFVLLVGKNEQRGRLVSNKTVDWYKAHQGGHWPSIEGALAAHPGDALDEKPLTVEAAE